MTSIPAIATAPAAVRPPTWPALRGRGGRAFAIVTTFMAVVALVSLVYSVRIVGTPFAGFLFYAFPAVGSFGDLEWPGIQAGARYQDIIVEADGQRIATSSELQTIVARTAVGERVRYVLGRHDHQLIINVPISVFTITDFVLLFGPTFVSGLFFGLTGVVVYCLKPNTGTSWAFFLFCFFLGTYLIAGLAIQAPPHGVWLYLVEMLALPFFPAASIHLSLLFPERTRLIERRAWLQYVPYAVAVGLAAYLLVTILSLTSGHLPPDTFLLVHSRLLRLIQLCRAYAVVGAVIVLAANAHAYKTSRSIIATQRARVILVGSALAFLPPTIGMPLVLLASVGIPFNFLGLSTVMFPAAIGYAIARHNLFDVDVYIKRALGYGVMTATVGIGYLSTQTVLQTVVLDPLFGRQAGHVSPIVFALLIVFLFNPLNRRVQDLVDRVFFRKRFDYKGTVSSVSNALTSMLNLGQIITQVTHTIRKEMFVDSVGMLVMQSKQRHCETFFTVDDDAENREVVKDVPVGYDDPLLVLVREEKRLITRFDIEEDPRYAHVKDGCLQSFSAMMASLAIPFVYHNEVGGMLTLGYKKSGQFYTREDVELLTTMADQAAVAIQNAAAHEEVVRYAEELAASLRRIHVLESIKTNLAKFVPKTVQDLIEESPEAPSFEKREADVSVVFADITGYTKLSSQMDLDQVNRLVERYFGAFLDEIVRHGGDVNETVGDGLMVIFRDADPDRHARAAVLAALGIQRRTAQINAELAGEFEPIAMHVGVNSGTASVGATKIQGTAGTRWTYTASGPTTNIAARLAALGEADAVILSEETRRRLDDEFQVDDLGPQMLKNVPHPVRVFRIKARGDERASIDAEDRRQHPRHPVGWAARVWVGDTAYEGHVVNASIHGILVAGLPLAVLQLYHSYRTEIVAADGETLTHVFELLRLSDGGAAMVTKEMLPLP